MGLRARSNFSLFHLIFQLSKHGLLKIPFSLSVFRFCPLSYLINLTHFWSFCYVPFQFSSVPQSCPTLCDPMNHSTPGLPVHHQLPEFTQTHVHWVGDTIQPSHPLLSASLPALNLIFHWSVFICVPISHLIKEVLLCVLIFRRANTLLLL